MREREREAVILGMGDGGSVTRGAAFGSMARGNATARRSVARSLEGREDRPSAAQRWVISAAAESRGTLSERGSTCSRSRMKPFRTFDMFFIWNCIIHLNLSQRLQKHIKNKKKNKKKKKICGGKICREGVWLTEFLVYLCELGRVVERAAE